MLTRQRPDQVVLHNLDWQAFETLLATLGERRSARVAYLDGELEIMSPIPEHEHYKTAISILIEDAAEYLEYDYECYGSATWKREMMAAGVEPDNCFYFQREALVRGKLQFNLEIDPPPDLALEIDLTSKSLPRLPLYARLGVPEIWCYSAGRLTIYQLENGAYQETEHSAIFPQLPLREIPQLIEKYRPLGRRAFRRAVRDWVKGSLLE
ncbi:MAG: Uma2 family endonuclease [Cyanobacteria bacterium RI_101]|nr:Uma2 family endonuclease [Cyanobacteria bacterium RI_101]